ncbi:WD40 repeat domain-containing protein [Phanerochaete sordida]|uniref:WD40 repeat domain-containing protein n=1 Tax=Phanerochaete sordida TaxID=48140 RepID=A0A9P3LK14_9APHY|nr:WD40 repeat domain-containing protein [Phanerochaete sordida]
MLNTLRNAHPQPSEVYAFSLAPVGEGYALWYPEPHESGGEVQLGDVGYVQDGAFMRLFNVAEDKELRIIGVPGSKAFPNPEILSKDAMLLDTRPQPLAPGTHRSEGVIETSLSAHASASGPADVAGSRIAADYTCQLNHGAVLVLRSAAQKQTIRDNYHIREYMKRHHAAWCTYVRDDRDGPRFVVDPEDIVLVRGWVKTAPTWEAVSFCNSQTRVTASADVKVEHFASVGAEYRKSRSVSGLKLTRKSPALHGADEHARADQCVFLNSYKIKYRNFGLFTKRELRAAAGPHQLPDDRDGRSGGTAEGVLASDVVMDTDDLSDGLENGAAHGPVNDLLDFILEVSNAECAIACDEDIQSLLMGQPWPSDMAMHLRQFPPTIETRASMGMISLPEKIQREREHKFYNREITDADRYEYPNLDAKDSGTLADGRALLGEARAPMNWRHLKMQHKDPENGAISCMAMSPDGKLVAAAWDDISVTVWRLLDGLTVQILSDQGHTDTIWALSFSADGDYVVSGSADKTALVWSVKNGDIVHRLEGHTEDVISVAYSPDGTTIATGSSDCTLKLWNAYTGELVHDFTDLGADVRRLVFSPSGARLASASDTAVALWDVRAGARTTTLRGHASAVWCLAFAPDGARLATGAEDSSARVWDAGSGDALVVLHEHTGSVWAAAWAPDGGALATASYDGTVVVCDSWSGERLAEFADARGAVVEAVAYAPCHDLVASGAADGRVRVWNAKTGAFVVEFEGHEEKVKNVMFTPDGMQLVSHADDGTIRAWSILDVLCLV